MERRFFILKAIIESFIESAEPVGSKYLVERYKMDVSPATIRNEMAVLEQLGLIQQPFTSAGRVPTDLGFRVFVDELMDTVPEVKDLKKQAIAQIHHRQDEDRLYNAVSLLARVCDNVSFAVLPGKKKTYYLGLANILRKPEFIDSARAYTVVKILEDAHHFVDLLDKLHIDDKVRVFIGRENIIPEIKSCSMIATKYHIDGYGSGVLGILGPMRMNYAYNIGALEYIRDSL
jgi:transcriptional regulator of heat shock response